VQTETEWQFDAMDVRPVSRWLDVWSQSGLGSVTPSSARHIHDRYLETDDWRIYRAGYTLRVRTQDGRSEVTLKGLPSEGSFRRRVEITEALVGGTDGSPLESPGPVGRRLRDVCGGRRLDLLFEILTVRRPYLVEAEAAAAELALDETTIPVRGRGRPVHLRRVEVEIRRGSPEALEGFVRDLEGGSGLRPAALTKFEAGLLSTGIAPPPPPEFGPTDADATSTVGEVAFAALRRQFQAFLRSEPGTRMGDDPEEVHDMRVATRRLRAAMSIFQEALPARSGRLRQELGWIADALGAVRDLDVQLERMGEWLDGVPADRDGGAEILSALQGARSPAREDLIRTLDSARYTRLVESFGAMLRKGPLRAQSVAWRPVTLEAPSMVADRRRAVRKALKRVHGAEDRSAALHKVRIRCKRLRYLLEFLGAVYREEVEGPVAALVKAQDRLGVLQDSIVGRDRLRELAMAPEPELGRTAVFLLGRFAERYEAQGRRAGRRFSKASSPVTGPAWKRLAKAMKRQEQQATHVQAHPPMALAEQVEGAPDGAPESPVVRVVSGA
jgi:triphosphatase